MVLGVLKRRAGARGAVTISARELVTETGLSERAVRGALGQLRAAGFVSRNHDGGAFGVPTYNVKNNA
jgi:DNA-binding GntR family transcriptional regulator